MNKNIMAQLPNQIIMDIIRKSTELKRQPFSPVLEQIKNPKEVLCSTDFWLCDKKGFGYGLFYKHYIDENKLPCFPWEEMEDDEMWVDSILYKWSDN
jgi:hypothetical protein